MWRCLSVTSTTLSLPKTARECVVFHPSSTIRVTGFLDYSITCNSRARKTPSLTMTHLQRLTRHVFRQPPEQDLFFAFLRIELPVNLRMTPKTSLHKLIDYTIISRT